jgi:uncharacterized protein YndB with AHSA1/START domain
MMTTEVSESIARAPEEVFRFVADVRNDPQWHTDVLEARLVQGSDVAVGSVFDIKTKPFMGTSGGTVTVSAYTPPRQIMFKVEMGKMKPTTTFTVEPEGSGARVSRKVEMEPPGLMRLMAPLMGGMFKKRNVGFLANLKRVMES